MERKDGRNNLETTLANSQEGVTGKGKHFFFFPYKSSVKRELRACVNC